MQRNKVPCHCKECKGDLVPPSTRKRHYEKRLRKQIKSSASQTKASGAQSERRPPQAKAIDATHEEVSRLGLQVRSDAY
ncbi:hypothetical protein C8T65DRAFT_664174 [Cerioporus squamosus]|nr:hypothetical protein C8T65DRAFT_664174 [Cerioporus squamosus]